MTNIDTANASMTGASPAVNVGETSLHATFAAGTVVQNTNITRKRGNEETRKRGNEERRK